jgi:ATP/ADP translocase/HEAT repeat protein
MSVISAVLQKLFSVRPEERRAFGWTSGLMFLILFSQMLFANFADTAFIKRFGVEYLPEMFLIDALVVFFAMDLIRKLVGRYSATTLLTRVFVIFAAIEILCRFLILLDFPLLYPFMYILRQQFDGVILIIFWNICNDIFDTRQSKRIFPLVTAGGILGRVLGGFSTSALTGVTSIDNLLFVSAGVLLLGIVAARRLEVLFPSPIAAPKFEPSEKKGQFSPFAGLREMSFLAKGSLLFVLLAAIRVLPNVVGPMYDFQFNVILDSHFAAEEELVRFFGVFRGAMNIITLGVLLVVGKVYTRVGIANALLFRPGNFFLVFSLLLFRFDILVGIYARLSISVLTTTLHNPANNIIINFFPDEFRAKIRPLLQMVSRAGSLVGSLILLGLKTFIHASYFSIFGLVFTAIWIYVTLRLKSNYSSFVLESLLERQVDLGELKEVDLSVLIQDKKTLNRLLEGLRDEKGEVVTLCARILAEARYPKLGEAILSVIGEKEMQVRVDLFGLLPAEQARSLVPRIVEIAETAPPWLMVHLVRAVGRLAPIENVDFLLQTCGSEEKAVQAEAIVGLYQTEMAPKGRSLLLEWIESPDCQDRLLAARTVARTHDVEFVDRLGAMLETDKDPTVQAQVIRALGALEITDRNRRILPCLISDHVSVRHAAVRALAFDFEETIERAIEMLGDESPDVRDAAFERISGRGKEVVPLLLKTLASPRRLVKDGVLRLLERLEVKEVEYSKFITSEIRHAYESIHASARLRSLAEMPGLNLMIRHLADKREDAIFTVFRILEVEGGGRKMRTIHRGLKSTAREKANALEALEDTLHPSLSRVLIPLVEESSLEEKDRAAQKHFSLPPDELPDGPSVLLALLDSEDSMTQACAVYALGEIQTGGFLKKLNPLKRHGDPLVRETATHTAERVSTLNGKGISIPHLSTMDKVVHLREIQIFSDLQVRELAAIGSVTRERDYGKGEIVVREGEPGDTMFLIISGKFSVIQNEGTPKEALVNTIAEGNCFGEMALFEGKPRANTVKSSTEARVLILEKRAFEEIMIHFPQIPISICRVFSERLRESARRVSQ